MKQRTVACWILLLLSAGLLAACDRSRHDSGANLTPIEQQMSRGEYRLAVIELENLLDREPNDPLARALLSESQFRAGDLAGAERSLELAVRAGAPAERTDPLRVSLWLAEGKARQLLTQLDSGELALAEPARSLARARAAAELKDYAAAELAYHSALAFEPNLTAAHLGLATLDVARGRLDAADDDLGMLGPAGARSAEAWRLRSVIDRLRGRSAAAEQALEKARTYAPGQLGIPERLAILASLVDAELANGQLREADQTYAQMRSVGDNSTTTGMIGAELAIAHGDRGDAAALLEHVVHADPKNLAPRFALAALQVRQDDPALQQTLAAILALAPSKAAAENAIGNLYFEAQRYPGALASYREATRLDSANAGYWLNVSRAQYALKSPDEALQTARKALALAPDSAATIGAVAGLEMRAGHGSQALARVLAARARLPNDPTIATLEGDARVSLGQYAQAAAAYERAADLAGSGGLAIRAYEALRQGRSADATAPLEQWLARHAGDTRVRFALAEAYRTAGEDSRATHEYETLAAGPDPGAAVLNNLAVLYQTIGDARAVPTARRAYELAPRVPQVGDTYGWMLVGSGDVAAGLPLLAQAAAGAPEDGEIAFHYAAALARAGQPERAAPILSTLLARKAPFQDRGEAQRLLQRIEERQASGAADRVPVRTP